MKKYGTNYQGSKSDLADWILSKMPASEVFVDLFAGGCAITDASSQSGKYKHVISNEIGSGSELFKSVSSGKKVEPVWIGRREFEKLVKEGSELCYVYKFSGRSFHYFCSEEEEKLQEAVFEVYASGKSEKFRDMCISVKDAEDMKARVKEIREQYVNWYINKYKPFNIESDEWGKEECVEYLESHRVKAGVSKTEINRITGTFMAGHWFGGTQWEWITEEGYNKIKDVLMLPLAYEEIKVNYGKRKKIKESLKKIKARRDLRSVPYARFESLNAIKPVECYKNIEWWNVDYKEVNIKKADFLYADPPYKNTEGYDGNSFNYTEFESWLHTVGKPVFVSEFTCPDGCIVVGKQERVQSFGSQKPVKVKELLCIQKEFISWYSKQDIMTGQNY